MKLAWGTDTDNFDGDVSVARYAALKAAGAAFNIVGCETGLDGKNYTALQIANSLEAGLLVPFTYKFPYWVDSDLDGFKRAVQFGYPVAMDLEYAEGMPGGKDATIDRVLQIRDYLISQGMYWGRYSGEWWLPGHMGDVPQMRGDRYWHAGYPWGMGKLPPAGWLPDFDTFHPYCGIQRPDVIQFADICWGEPTFDLNAMFIEEENDVMLRHNTIATQLQGQGAGNYLTNVFDLPPPPNTKRLRLELFLEKGGIQVKDSNGAYAGQVGWDGGRYGTVDVDVSGGSFTLEGSGVLAQIGIVGLWS